MKRYPFITLILSFILSYYMAMADTPSRKSEDSHQQSVAPTAGGYARLFSDLANPPMRKSVAERLNNSLMP